MNFLTDLLIFWKKEEFRFIKQNLSQNASLSHTFWHKEKCKRTQILFDYTKLKSYSVGTVKVYSPTKEEEEKITPSFCLEKKK